MVNLIRIFEGSHELEILELVEKCFRLSIKSSYEFVNFQPEYRPFALVKLAYISFNSSLFLHKSNPVPPIHSLAK